MICRVSVDRADVRTVIEQAVRNVQQVFGEHMKAFEISPAVLQGLKSITQEA